MDKKIIWFLVISFWFLVFFNFNVNALGITPGRSTFDYEPGAQKIVDFTVVNTDKKDVSLVVLIEGELNSSISLSEVSFDMNAGEESKNLAFTLDMPYGLSPGLHESRIVVLELPGKNSAGGAFVGSVVGVATQIHVNVPYPGKYAEGELNIINDDKGKIIFAIPIVNRGDLDLVRVRGVVDIYTSLNEKIASVNTNEISLTSKERKEIAAEWDSSAVNPGPYRAAASVLYDEKVLTLQKEFSVGAKKISLEDIAVNDFSLGEIAKFEIFIRNDWSEKITDAYAEMAVYNKEGEKMAEFKSANYDIAPLSKSLMVAFWDTEGVKEGTYDSTLFLRYGDSSEQRDLKLDVTDKSIDIIGFGYNIKAREPSGKTGIFSTTNILIGVVVLLVLINLSWFMFLRKKFAKR